MLYLARRCISFIAVSKGLCIGLECSSGCTRGADSLAHTNPLETRPDGMLVYFPHSACQWAMMRQLIELSTTSHVVNSIGE